MLLNIDYRGVNKEVWELLHKLYGGGPMIARNALNIYGKDVNKDVSIKYENIAITNSSIIQSSLNSQSQQPTG